MNFREFCSVNNYSHFLGLTYNFDPLFFEAVILKDLIRHGINNNIIFCDINSLLKTLEQVGTETKALGKQYILNSVHIADGAFHPKVYLLLGASGFKLGIGSGNLTFGGTGANHEVISVWESDNLKDKSLAYLLSYIDSLTLNEIAKDYMLELRDRYHLEPLKNYNLDSSNFLLRPFDKNLASLIEKRWAGKNFDDLIVFTGSTDEKGAFIEWCRIHLGIKKCTIVGNRENISLLPSHLNKIPVHIIIAPWGESRLMHGKVYLFKKGNRYSVISGSANCSAAAWLTPLNKHGNIECITVFEDLSKKSVEHFLELIPYKSYTTKEWKPTKLDNKEKTYYKKNYVIEHLVINYDKEVLELKLIKPDQYIGDIYLCINEEDIKFETTPRENVWVCNYLSSSNKSNVVKLKFVNNDKINEISYWIDDPYKIKKFSFHYKLQLAFTNLNATKSFKEARNLISELLAIQSLIFDSSNYYNNVFSCFDSNKKDSLVSPTLDETITTIKPEMIVKSITESPLNSPLRSKLSIGNNSFSFLGILRFLFEDFHYDEDIRDENIEDRDLDDNNDFSEDVEINNPNQKTEKVEFDNDLTDEEKIKLYNKFENFINDFIYEITTEAFISTCTARQFSDTIAFSLLIIIKILSKSYYLQSLSQYFLSELLNALFFKDVNDKSKRGIYIQVYSRYKDEDKEALFVKEIGGGYLWVSLILAMLLQKIAKPSTTLVNSIFLTYIYTNDLLLKHLTTSSLVFPFISGSKTKQFKALFEKLPTLITKFGILEQSLENSYIDLQKKDVATDYNEEQIIFNRKLRWGKIVELSDSKMKVLILNTGQVKTISTKGYWISPLALIKGKGAVQDNYNNLLDLLNSIQGGFEEMRK